MAAMLARRRPHRLVALALVPVLYLVMPAPDPVAAASGVPPAPGPYRPPVTGAVIDPFRAPATPYGAGNRGIDYATQPLSPAHAAADGEVIFAGPVAGTLHVTVRHADGLRTSYSFLASVSVRVGQTVRAGDVIGLTIEVFHFGVRDPAGTYLDPAALFGASARAHLVPGGDDGTGAEGPAEPVALGLLIGELRGSVETQLARASGLAPGAPALGLVDRTRLWAQALADSTGAPHAARIRAGLLMWAAERTRCTPAAEAPPPPSGRRILVEVGGIGSSSDHAAVTRVDTATLGYAPGDVVRFSYAGGRVPATSRADPGPLDRLAATTYTPRDSQSDLRDAGSRLADLLEAVAAAAPGVPVDVVAHSQGGVVARLALHDAQERGRLPPALRTVVTLGSPHQGADLAAAAQAAVLTERGRRATSSVQAALGLELDADLPAATQLAPTSAVIDELRALAPPPSVRLVSVGARGDVVVPANRTAIAGAPSTVVAISGERAHDRLPGTPEATREIALAINGRDPTCRSFTEVAADLVVSERISQLESALGLATATAVDRIAR
jgi:hypothetical protein